MKPRALREAFADLPDPPKDLTTWTRHRRALRNHVAKGAIEKFLRWSTIQATMFVAEAPHIVEEFETLMEDRELWEPVLQEPGVGDPPRLSYAPWTSGNLVHQAYHLKQWMDKSGKSLPEAGSVVEIGGGYGAMALICQRLGGSNYTIFDLEELELLQRYYLQQAIGSHNITWYSTSEYIEYYEDDLCIALFSLGEMPLEDRYIPRADSYLLAFHPRWEGINNHEYFAALVKDRGDLNWHLWKHNLDYWYLVGV